jgi:hypothetical protein
MACQVVNPGNPYLWIFLSGCFFGITLAQMTIPPADSYNPRRGRVRKWTLVYIFASLFLSAGLAGFFIAGWRSFTSQDMVYYGAAAAGVCGLAFRFKKSVGIAVLFLLIIFIVYFGFITYPLACIGKGGDAGWFRVLEYRNGQVRIEAGTDGSSGILELEGNSVTPVVSTLSISKHFILYGGKTLYLLNGMFPGPDLYTEGKQEAAAFARRLPGVAFSLLYVKPFRPPVFQRYRILLETGVEGPVLHTEPIFSFP